MKFATEFLVIYPFVEIMFGSRGDLSAAQIGAILSAGFVMSVVFEVPTGVVADSMPRKHVLIFSILCRIIALAAWFMFPFFWGYMLGAMFFALGSAFESGALQAYLYSTLGKAHKQAFGKFWTRAQSLVMVSFTSAFLLAAVIGTNYPVLLTCSIAASVIALAFAVSLPKDTLAVSANGEKPKIITSALSHIFHNKDLARLLLSSVVVIALSETIINYLSLYNMQIGIPVRIIPLLLAAGNLVGAALFWTLPSWEGFLNTNKTLLAIGTGVFFTASFFGNIATACVGVLVFTRFVRVLQVQFDASIQHLSNDEARATITSIGSFAAKLVAAGIIALIGLSAVNNSIVQPVRIALLVGLTLFILLQLLLHRTERSH